MSFKRLPLCGCFFLIFLTACVPSKSRVHYDAVGYQGLRRQDLIMKLNDLQTRLDTAEKGRLNCTQAYAALERRFQDLKEENRQHSMRIEQLESELAEINFAFEVLRREKREGIQQE